MEPIQEFRPHPKRPVIRHNPVRDGVLLKNHAKIQACNELIKELRHRLRNAPLSLDGQRVQEFIDLRIGLREELQRQLKLRARLVAEQEQRHQQNRGKREREQLAKRHRQEEERAARARDLQRREAERQRLAAVILEAQEEIEIEDALSEIKRDRRFNC